MMDNGLVMLQTTNDVYNMTLFDYVVPQTVPSWVRVRVANQKSTKSSEWGAWVEQHNSGIVAIAINLKLNLIQHLGKVRR